MEWGPPVVINNIPIFPDAGRDARNIFPGRFGSEYPRMVQLANGDWIVVYTIYDNVGYPYEAHGGTRLQVAKSVDGARNWTVLATVSDPGRDLDNGHLVPLRDGGLLLAARSVRWQESYRLPVYVSPDGGQTWNFLSTIDANENAPGNPDKGMYEPHFFILDGGKVAVMYANERHVVEDPSYSQIISQKVSQDDGATWGPELWVAAQPGGGALRPGMPVWTKMQNGKYIVVYEIVDGPAADIHFKVSDDGVTWPDGLGTRIPYQWSGPYILSLADGQLILTSNSIQISESQDHGATWIRNDPPPWPFGSLLVWSSLYQTGSSEVAILSSLARAEGGHNIQIKFATLSLP